MGCSCSSQQALRFKNLVVAVYPRNEDGEFNKDAMGKLRSYVASNPDRIPRVCRKVTKLISADVLNHHVKRGTVGAHILRDLVDYSAELESFVPYCIDVALKLFAQPEAEFRIAAADIVSIVSVKLQDRWNTDSARRLLADSQLDVLRSLRGMMEDGIGTNDIISLHCRYASLVATGNITECFSGPQLMADQMALELMPSVLLNLNELAKSIDTPSRAVTSRKAPPPQAAAWTQPEGGPILNIAPPLEADQKDAAFIRASIRAISGLAGCSTSAGLTKLLPIVVGFANRCSAWTSNNILCISVFRAVTLSLQRRPQQLGYSVVQFLLDEAHSCSDDDYARHCAVLECISSCVEVIPVTSSRPHAIFEAVRAVITKASADRDITQRLCMSAAVLTNTLAERTSQQRNWPQLSRMISEVLQLLPKTQEKLLLCAQLKVLSCLLQYISQLADDERSRLGVVEAIQPYLNTPDDMRAYAARCLTAMISSAALVDPQSQRRAAADDVESAQIWLRTACRSTDHSALSLAEVGHLAAALLFSRKVKCLPFVLPWVMDLQQYASPQRTELGRAWHHLCISVIHVLAEVLQSPALASYATDLLSRRLHADPPELPQSFSQRLAKPTVTRCGLSISRSVDAEAPLTNTEEAAAPPVTTLITLSTLVVYVLRGPEAPAVLAAFHVSGEDALEAKLRQLVNDFGATQSSRNGRKTTDSVCAAPLSRTGVVKKEELPGAPASQLSVLTSEIKLLPEPPTRAELEAKIFDGLGNFQEPRYAQTIISRMSEVYSASDVAATSLTAVAPTQWTMALTARHPGDSRTTLNDCRRGTSLDGNASFTVSSAVLLRTEAATALMPARSVFETSILRNLDSI
jgi:hypothetical protein